ncbi:MAG: hypothetical protein H0T66_11600 [Geodermatophilaceae bacterium]|nr:hypothetical protein [Geodermatophilaceae bacterium]MDQ3454014.1 hypothetical protein [Actinomycetota bacterium]
MRLVGMVLVGLTASVLSGCSDTGPAETVCTPRGTEYRISSEQAAHAATIAAVGRSRGLPERAVTIALATALQESGLRNLAYGDRDSLGLFQQRPSQGWGTPDQVTEPRYAAAAFYAALTGVPDWEGQRLTEAAQAVQRSAFPEAYQQWEPQAEALTAALGDQPAGLSCAAAEPPTTPQAERQDTLAQLVEIDFAVAPSATGPDLLRWPAAEQGWPLAHWLVAHAAQFGITDVSFDGRRWSGSDGWGSDTAATDSEVTARVAAAQDG